MKNVSDPTDVVKENINALSMISNEKDEKLVIRRHVPFTMIENSIIDDERLTCHEKMVYTVLARYANINEKKCWPSLSTISKKACTSRQGVVNSLNQLEEYGYITRTRRKHKNGGPTSTLYELQGEVVKNRHGGSQKQVLDLVKNRHLNNNTEQDLKNNNNKPESCCRTSLKEEPGKELIIGTRNYGTLTFSSAFVAKHGRNRIKPVVEYFDVGDYTKRVENIPGFITRAIEENWEIDFEVD